MFSTKKATGQPSVLPEGNVSIKAPSSSQMVTLALSISAIATLIIAGIGVAAFFAHQGKLPSFLTRLDFLSPLNNSYSMSMMIGGGGLFSSSIAVLIGRAIYYHRKSSFGLPDTTAQKNNASPKNPDSLDRTPAMIAVEKGDLDLLNAIIEKNPECIKEEDQEGNTLLHAVCRNGNLDAVKILISKSPDLLLSYGKSNKIPFHIAVESGHLQIVEYLLTENSLESYKKALLSAATMDNWMKPIHLAAEKNQAEILALLLKHGADVELKHKEKTPLQIAAAAGNEECVDKLIQALKEQNLLNNDALFDALEEAIFNHRENIALKILEKIRADSVEDVEYYTHELIKMLHIAIHAKMKDLINTLLKKGASIFDFRIFNDPSKDPVPKNAFHVAIETGDNTIFKELCEQVDIEHFYIDCQRENYQSFSPLEYAAVKNNVEALKIMHEKGANLGQKGYANRTLLQLATEANATKTAIYLIENNASLQIDEGWQAPSTRAIIKGNTDILEAMISKGLNLKNLDNVLGYSPFHYAILTNNATIIKFMLKKDPTLIELKSAKGKSLVEIALFSSDLIPELSLVALIEMGAKLPETIRELSPFMYCLENNMFQLAQALLEKKLVKKELLKTGKTLLMTALEIIPIGIKNRLKIFELLITNVKENDVDASGKNILFFVKDREAAAFFIQKGANVNHKDNSGAYPIHTAIFNNNVDVLHVLINKGKADLTVTLPRIYGSLQVNLTPLDLAKHLKNNCIDVLTKAGAK